MLSLLLIVSAAFSTATPAFADPVLTDPNVARFKNDVEQILVLRAQTNQFYFKMKDAVAKIKTQAIPKEYLDTLDTLNTRHTQFAAELKTFIVAARSAKASNLKPADMASATTLTLELAAELTYIDSIYQVVRVFQELGEARKILNRADPTTGREKDVLYRTMLAYYSIPYYARRADLIAAFDAAKSSAEFKTSPNMAFLSQYIEQSGTYKHYESESYYERAREKFRMGEAYVKLRTLKDHDNLDHFFSHKVVGDLSKVFGNAVGSIQFRDGKLKGNMEIAKRMHAVLQPGDLLLEATPFRATSKFIPGHYGHVAMWVGTEAQIRGNPDFKGVWEEMWARTEASMKRAGLLKPDSIANAKMSLRNGAAILEALRPEVVLNTPEHFLDIDDLLILRPDPTRLGVEDIRRALVTGMTHLGQKYDFNFDDETNDQIVCSELALTAYPKVHFHEKWSLGRSTISPDDVALQGLWGAPFIPVMMVRDGKVIQEKLQDELGNALGKRQFGGAGGTW